MNEANLIINVIYLLITSGLVSYIVNVISKHTKNKHFANGLKYAQVIASQFVAKYANDPTTPKGQRRGGVVHDLQVILDAHGYHFNIKYLTGVAEHAYQVYKNNGGNVTKAEKVAAPVVNDVKDDIENVAKSDTNDLEHVTLTKDKLNQILTNNRNEVINNLKTQGLINN